MVDHIVDASAARGRVESRSGVGRRRRWSEEEKGRIVVESYARDAVVSEVARRHEINPQHLFAWRKAASESDRTDRTLDDIGVDLDAAVVEGASKPVPARERVADRAGDGRLAGDGGELGVEPQTQGIDERLGTPLPRLVTLVGGAAADIGLENASRSSIRLPILFADSRIVCMYRRLLSSSKEDACFCSSSE